MLLNRRHIAILSSPKSWGGGEEYAWTLGQSLQMLGYRVSWIVPESSSLAARLRKKGITPRTFSGKRPSPREIFDIRRQLRCTAVDVLFANDSRAIGWSAWLTTGAQPMLKIGVKHTIFPIQSALKYNWLLDRVVCVSEACRQVCVHGGIEAAKLEVLSGATAVEVIDRIEARREIAAHLNIPVDQPLYVNVGSLIACKGIDTLIDAAKLLKLRGHKFTIAICGEGPLQYALEQKILASDLKREVRLLGFQDEPNKWIAACDMLVHPSRSEGLSLVTIAAQLLGVPVVATDVGGLREVIHSPIDDSPLGWSVPADSPLKLATMIERVGGEKAAAESRAIKAQQFANLRYTPERMVRTFLSMLEKLELSRCEQPAWRFIRPRAA